MSKALAIQWLHTLAKSALFDAVFITMIAVVLAVASLL